jgi:hypothetical protein
MNKKNSTERDENSRIEKLESLQIIKKDCIMRHFTNKITVFALLCISVNSCLTANEKNQDWSETILLSVASEKALYYPIEGAGASSSGIKVKEDNCEYWITLPLNDIQGFHYEEGYEYRLKVLKIHLANPPMDSSDVRYKLIKIISKSSK